MKKLFFLLSAFSCLCLMTQCDPACVEQALFGDYTLRVDSESVVIPSQGGTFNDILFTTNTSWTAFSNAAWLQVTLAAGDGGDNQCLSYEVSQNTSDQRRTAVITIEICSNTFQVQVTQEGRNPLNVTEIQLPAGPDPVTGLFQAIRFTFEASTAWNIEISETRADEVSWLRLDKTSGPAGSQSVLVTPEESNFTGEERSATINVIIGTSTNTVKVNQPTHFLTRWAEANLGDSTCGEYGDYFLFNSLPTCPEGYHIPTKAEFDSLCTYPSVCVEAALVSPPNVPGRWFCSTEADKLAPSTDRGCVFFPAAGFRQVRSNGNMYTNNRGTYAFYWSSTPSESDSNEAYYLYFSNSGGNAAVYCDNWLVLNDLTYWYGHSVRCIK